MRGALFFRFLMLSLAIASVGPAPAGDWPQWRGPDRTNVSKETGLLKEWPKDGPPLLWKAEGMGDGVASVAVAGGRVFSLGYRGEGEFVTALDVKDGKQAWSSQIGPKVNENSVMRWLSQRTPTVDGDRLYAVTTGGELICLESGTGKDLWRKSYSKDFNSRRPGFGYCDYPLVDGDQLICSPGGPEAGLVALNKKTGELIWQAALPGNDGASFSCVVPAEIGGVRQYVNCMSRGLVGVSAKDGKFLWRYDKLANGTGNSGAAIVRGDLVFFANGYGAGCGVVKIVADGTGFKAEEVWSLRKSFPSWLGGSVLVGDHVYLCQVAGIPLGIEWETGKVVAEGDFRFSQSSLTYADGHLYLRNNAGKAGLIQAGPEGFKLKGSFDPPRPATTMTQPAGAFPVIADGRLYLRDMDWLLCYDIQAPKQGRGPRPIFVPSPEDVVDKMLELAQVKQDDVVVDLGCGDGRILVAAARLSCCKAIGYDIDPDCVRQARENVRQGGVEGLVRIEQADIFDVDLSQASVVTLYLLPTINAKLVPQLEKLKPGSRIVSHAFNMPGYKPDKVIRMTSKEDDLERPIYLWTIPLQKE